MAYSGYTPPTDAQLAAQMRRAAGFSLGLAIGAAGLVALAGYLSRPDAKIPAGPNIDAVENWLRQAAIKMQSGAKKIIDEIDKAG